MFRLRCSEADSGLDIERRFATESQAMDYADGLASERPDKQHRQLASHATTYEPPSRH